VRILTSDEVGKILAKEITGFSLDATKDQPFRLLIKAQTNLNGFM